MDLAQKKQYSFSCNKQTRNVRSSTFKTWKIDRQITIPAPDLKGRLEILKIHAQKKKLSDEVNLESIAEDTAGLQELNLLIF